MLHEEIRETHARAHKQADAEEPQPKAGAGRGGRARAGAPGDPVAPLHACRERTRGKPSRARPQD